MAQPTPSQIGSPRGKAQSAFKETELDALQSPEASEQEYIPGQNVKEARGLSKDAGHSPHEAGTDQRVEDAKKERDRNR